MIMKTTKLKKEINEQVRNNGDVLNDISKAMKKSIGRVRNWFYEDSENLTNYDTLKVISEHTGIAIEDLVTETETEKVKS